LKRTKISDAVIKRLPQYRRYLLELEKQGVHKISSQEFSDIIGYTASQIRQDLNNFGGFGQQGYGYSVKGLRAEIDSILGLDKQYRMVIIGAGNLGQAIFKYTKTFNGGFKVCAIFEIKPELIGTKLEDIVIRDYKDVTSYIEHENIDIGIICVNRENAQEVADKLCSAGVKGIWSFARTDIEVPSDVALEIVQLSDSLHALAYYMNDIETSDEEAEDADSNV
jgi:redox-sensing transcriptional repressor